MPSKANVIARVIFDKNLNYKKKRKRNAVGRDVVEEGLWDYRRRI